MSGRSLQQTSFFSPEFVAPGCLKKGTLPWLLRTYRAVLMPPWLLADWGSSGGRGRVPWDGGVLMATCLLRYEEEGMSRKAMVRRLKRDITWLAATGLEIGGKTPSESTFCRFERYLRARDARTGLPRYLLLREHLIRVCTDRIDAEVLRSPIWAFDSTPMWCYGAALDTVRLLGEGLRALGSTWAKATGQSRRAVAACWELPLLLAKSTKGHYRTDWRDPDRRADVLHRIATDVMRVVERVLTGVKQVRGDKRKRLYRLCRHLLKVIRDDMERDKQGRLVVATHVAADRLVSLTDPRARLSRKSKSKSYKGFKIGVLGDVVSGLIASLTVTPANIHDAKPGARLIRRAQRLFGKIERVLGDTAYAGADLHRWARDVLGVDVLGPPPPVPRREGKLNIADFDVDMSSHTALCPAGVTTTDFREGRTGTRGFCWPKATCGSCLLRTTCFGKSAKAKRLVIRRNFEELQMLRRRWEDPKMREQYRVRSQCERLINQVIRHGGRRARAWGLHSATLGAWCAWLPSPSPGASVPLCAREPFAEPLGSTTEPSGADPDEITSGRLGPQCAPGSYRPT